MVEAQARISDELSGFILAMQGNVIPFPACTFDVVINNQVMEHVEDIDAALSGDLLFS